METGTLLLLLVVGLLVAVSVYGIVSARRPSTSPDETFAASTEGMTVCPKCGMGNLWTERRCSACGNSLKG